MIEFDRAICLTLPAASERRARFEAGVSAIDWPFPDVEMVDAVAADAPNLPPVPSWWREGPAAWAHTQSHIAVWQQAIDDGCSSLVVFEDTAHFGEAFGDRVERFFAAVPSDWDLLYLGGRWENPGRYRPQVVNDEVLSVTRVLGTYAYAAGVKFLARAIPLVTGEKPKVQQIGERLGMLQADASAYAPWQWCVGIDLGVTNRDSKSIVIWCDLQQDVLRRLHVPCSSTSSDSSDASPIALPSESAKPSIPNPSSEFGEAIASEKAKPSKSKSETSGSDVSEPSKSSSKPPT